MVCQRRGQKGQPTQTGKRHQRTKNSRQKSRTENQIADEEVKQSKKNQGDVGGLSIQFEKHERQSLQLLRLEYAQVWTAS